jgi:hypothetical protein
MSCHVASSFIPQSDQIQQLSRESIGSAEYDFIWTNLQDSIDLWRTNRLEWSALLNIDEWQLDSTICINSSKNKLVGTILKKCTYHTSCRQDDLQYIYGVKIEGVWFFFYGGTQVLTQHKSTVGGKEVWTPNTFEELHDFAVKLVYRGYLRRGDDGSYEINDGFFSNMGCRDGPRPGYCQCKTCETFEDWVLYTVRENWQKRDRTDYKKIKENEQKPQRKL